MIRVAFTLIGGDSWTGGYNYLVNLLRAITTYQSASITPVLFVPAGSDKRHEVLSALTGVEIVRGEILDQGNRKKILAQALLLGRVPQLVKLFEAHRIDVVFEAAQFFGWRLGLPAIAWIPDFQHRMLPQFFSKAAWWKREIGFRAQIFGGRTIMLSSDDARRACEHFYPATKSRTHVVHFAARAEAVLDERSARAIADSYGLPQNFVFLPNQFWRHKNHKLVLEALLLLRDVNPDIVIAASGRQYDPRSPDYFPTLEALVKENGLEKHFRFLGLIPYEHVSALMRSCQVLLNPSLFEGWSTTVEEARSFGTPMLLSDLPVHHEQMGDFAVYFNRYSAVDLAEKLQAVSAFNRAQRKSDYEAARRDSETRMKQYAADFAHLVERVARATPK